MKKKNTKSLGKLGEDIIVKYLKKNRGWKVIGRNFSKPWGEIDIIARDKDTIIFVEVKALDCKNVKYFKPEEHFDHKKRQRVIKTAFAYLIEKKYLDDVDYRIDLAALEINSENKIARLRYYENVIA